MTYYFLSLYLPRTWELLGHLYSVLRCQSEIPCDETVDSQQSWSHWQHTIKSSTFKKIKMWWQYYTFQVVTSTFKHKLKFLSIDTLHTHNFTCSVIDIYLIEITWSPERHKPWMMPPDGFVELQWLRLIRSLYASSARSPESGPLSDWSNNKRAFGALHRLVTDN